MDHHAAQRALVRMLYDPGFEAALRADPSSVGVEPEVARLLAGIDPRALRADPLRRRRTLGTLLEEFRAASTLALEETRSLASLEGFFAAPEFHRSVEERRPLVLAFGAYLLRACAEGRLRGPHTADVTRLELLQARARREARDVPVRADAATVALAPGVLFHRFDAAVLDVVHRVERLLFELTLLPQLGLCDDRPRLDLPPRAGHALPLLVVPTPSGLSLVTADAELEPVVAALAEGPLPRGALVARAARSGTPAARVEALVAELLDDGVLEGLDEAGDMHA